MANKSGFGGLGVLGALDTDGLARALAGAGVGRGALAADGQAPAVADPTVTIDALEPLEIGLNFATKITLDRELARLDRVDDFRHLLRTELVRADVRVDPGLLKNASRGGGPDAINVWQGGFDALFAGDINSKKTGHLI